MRLCVVGRSLEWVIEDDTEPSRAPTMLARKMSTRLPSFGEAFTQQVPLTRIRDIAHRNDIPSVSLAVFSVGSGLQCQYGAVGKKRLVRVL